MDTLTVGAKTYRKVTVIGANTTDLYFKHADGLANVKLKYLSPALQAKFNYDAAAATAAERKQVEEDVRFQTTLATSIAANRARTNELAQKLARTSEQNFADPVSDQSLLGKPAPALKPEKWTGTEPDTKGKVVLVAFWEPWSIPSRKCLADWNALQKKFPEKLVVIGVSSENDPDAQKIDEKIDFATAIDSKAALSTSLGVTCVPSVLLVDAKGIVRYQGHPSAVTEKKLQELTAKVEEASK